MLLAGWVGARPRVCRHAPALLHARAAGGPPRWEATTMTVLSLEQQTARMDRSRRRPSSSQQPTLSVFVAKALIVRTPRHAACITVWPMSGQDLHRLTLLRARQAAAERLHRCLASCRRIASSLTNAWPSHAYRATKVARSTERRLPLLATVVQPVRWIGGTQRECREIQ